jgi:hypothetical protein
MHPSTIRGNRLPKTRSHLDIPGRAFYLYLEACYQFGHVSIDDKALQTFDELHVFIIGNIDYGFWMTIPPSI